MIQSLPVSKRRPAFSCTVGQKNKLESNSANCKDGEGRAAVDEVIMRNLPSSEWSEMQTEITSSGEKGILDVKLCIIIIEVMRKHVMY